MPVSMESTTLISIYVTVGPENTYAYLSRSSFVCLGGCGSWARVKRCVEAQKEVTHEGMMSADDKWSHTGV